MSKEEIKDIAERLHANDGKFILVKVDDDGDMDCAMHCKEPADFLSMLTAIVVAQPKTRECFKIFANQIDELMKTNLLYDNSR